jgi:hypothetical protein
MREREQRIVYHTVLGVAMVLSACNAGDPAPEPGAWTIRGDQPIEGQLLIDLRDETRGYLFDGRWGALPLDDALLICPDGTWMRLHTWLSARAEETGTDFTDRAAAVFSLGHTHQLSERAIAEASVPGCEQAVCEQCPDGAWICSCPGGRDPGGVTRDDDGSGGGGYEDFYDRHPRNPYGDGYGGSGDGSGGGGSGSWGGSAGQPPPE